MFGVTVTSMRKRDYVIFGGVVVLMIGAAALEWAQARYPCLEEVEWRIRQHLGI